MIVVDRIKEFHNELTAWRQDLHAHPETAFEEVRTSQVVAERLESFGIEVHRGIGRTGVVGVLRAGSGQRAIGLRADMDALHIREQNAFEHRSRNDGRMHACGHDGHTTMLLGAARYLAETRPFDGTVYFIFQPAEENEGGGRVMIEDGLFDRFPMESVYGMHNWPGVPAGHFGLRAGPMMASFDIFEVSIAGRGSHAALPHTGIDPIVAGSQLVAALQTIVSRNVDPIDAGVVSVTQFHGGDTWNVIPEGVVLRGTTRSFRPDTQDLIERRLREAAEGVARLSGTKIDVRYERRYPSLINSAAETEVCRRVAEQLVGAERVTSPVEPVMGGEDFAFMLQAKPGCYVFIGNGPGEGGCMLHNPRYDFNDAILPVGASYWVRLVETLLPKR
ncbi:MAG TPA: M20 aminoacylase family protein [Burkholderiaceae bacterium]|nr:M20 aminoacylase family protein [Burkholderiaceae bacterium]